MTTVTAIHEEQDRSSARRALLDQLFGIAKSAFPGIEILIYEANPSFNAQAYIDRDQQTVTLFGGLAFHRRMGKDGLLFTILHEIGHHIAPGPRLTVTSPLSCDCAADRWTVGEGRRLVSAQGMTLDIRSALGEIEAAALRQGGAVSNLESGNCCFGWARRKKTLISVDQPPLKECEFRIRG